VRFRTQAISGPFFGGWQVAMFEETFVRFSGEASVLEIYIEKPW
jgi:hypothetical protein